MAMTNYYCLVAGLPDLSLEDGKLNYTVANFKSEIPFIFHFQKATTEYSI